MSKQTEALKLALEALSPWAGEDANHTEQYAAYHAIREALAEQPAQQEPVAWKDRTYGNLHHQDFGNSIPLYTSPPARKPWVGLTDEEWQEIDASLNGKRDLARIFVGAIEAKLREKNV